jgi:hypothetical protein
MEFHLMFGLMSNIASDLAGYNNLREILPAGLAQVLAGLYGLDSESQLLSKTAYGLEHVNTSFIIKCLKDNKAPKNRHLATHHHALLIAADMITAYNMQVSLAQLQALTILASAIDPEQILFNDDLKVINRTLIDQLEEAFNSEKPLQTLSESGIASDDLQAFLNAGLPNLTGELNKKSTVITPPLPVHNELSQFTTLLQAKLDHIVSTEKDKLQRWQNHLDSIDMKQCEKKALMETLKSLNANTDYASFRSTLPEEAELVDGGDAFYDASAAPIEQLLVLQCAEQVHDRVHPGKDYLKETISDIVTRLISDANAKDSSHFKDTELFLLFSLRDYFSGSWISTLTELSKSPNIPRSSYLRFIGVASLTLLTSPPANEGAKNLTHKLSMLDLFAQNLSTMSNEGITDHSSLLELMLYAIITSLSTIDETRECGAITPPPVDLPSKNWVLLSTLSLWYSQKTGQGFPTNIIEHLHIPEQPSEIPYLVPSSPEASYREACVEFTNLFSELITLHHCKDEAPLLSLIARHSAHTPLVKSIWYSSSFTTSERIFWTLQNWIAPYLNLNILETNKLHKAIALSSKSGFESILLLLSALHLDEDLLLKPMMFYGENGMRHLLSKLFIRAIGGNKINPKVWNENRDDKLLQTAYTVDANEATAAHTPDIQSATFQATYDVTKGFYPDLPDFKTLNEHISQHTDDLSEKCLLLFGCTISKDLHETIKSPQKIDNIYTLILFSLAGQDQSDLQNSPLTQKAVEAAASALGTSPTELKNAPLRVAMKTIAPDFEPSKAGEIFNSYSPIQTWKQAFTHALTSHVILTSFTTSLCCIAVGYTILMLLNIPIASLAVVIAFSSLLTLNLFAQWIGTKYITNQLNQTLSNDPFSAQTLCQKIISPNQTTATKVVEEPLSASVIATPGA